MVLRHFHITQESVTKLSVILVTSASCKKVLPKLTHVKTKLWHGKSG